MSDPTPPVDEPVERKPGRAPRLKVALAILALLLLLMVVVGVSLLATAPGRSLVTARVIDAAASAGLELEVGDWRLSRCALAGNAGPKVEPIAGSGVLVTGLVVENALGERLLRIERACVVPRWRSLFGAPRQLAWVEVQGVDATTQGWPEAEDEEPEAPLRELPVEIDQLLVSQANLELPEQAPLDSNPDPSLAASLPGLDQPWLARIRGATLAGRLSRTATDLRLTAGLEIAGGSFKPQTVEVEASANGALPGQLRLDPLRARGEGIDLEVALAVLTEKFGFGEAGSDSQDPAAHVVVNVEIEPERLLVFGDNHQINAAVTGDLDLRMADGFGNRSSPPISGSAKLRISDLAGEDIAPWVGLLGLDTTPSDAYRGLEATTTRLALDVEVSASEHGNLMTVEGDGLTVEEHLEGERDLIRFETQISALELDHLQSLEIGEARVDFALAVDALPVERLLLLAGRTPPPELAGTSAHLQAKLQRVTDVAPERLVGELTGRLDDSAGRALIRAAIAGWQVPVDGGTLDTDGMQGTLELVSHDLAGERLLDLLRAAGVLDDPALAEHAEASLPETTFDLAMAGELSGLGVITSSVDGVFDWTSEKQAAAEDLAVVRLSGKTGASGRMASGSSLALVADLLPEQPGTRHLDLEVAGGRLDLTEAGALSPRHLVVGGALAIESAELASTLNALHRHLPTLVPAVASSTDDAADPVAYLAGPLKLTAAIDGQQRSAPFRLTVDGELRAQPTATEGGESLAGAIDLSGGLAFPRRDLKAAHGEIILNVDALDLAALGAPLEGRLTTRVSWDAARPEELSVRSLTARQGTRTVDSSGQLSLAWPPGPSALSVRVDGETLGIETMTLALRHDEHGLVVDATDLATRSGPGALHVEASHPALAALLEELRNGTDLTGPIGELIESWKHHQGSELIELHLELPSVVARGGKALALEETGFDASPGVVLVREPPAPGEAALVTGDGASALGRWDLEIDGLALEARFDPRSPMTRPARLRLDRLALATDRGDVRTAAPVVVALRDAAVAAETVALEVSGRPFRLEAGAALDPALRLADLLSPDATDGTPPPSPVTSVTVAADGELDLELIASLVPGVIPQGIATIDLDLEGPPGALSGSFDVDGEEATLVWPVPYPTHLSAPKLHGRLDQGRLLLEQARSGLNEGQLEITGSIDPREAIDLDIALTDVRYRLDYGVSSIVDGALDLHLPMAVFEPEPADGESPRGRIGGNVDVRRGLLRRDVDLEREVLGALFTPTTGVAGANNPGRRIDLDLEITTREGLRVRNNVADLRVLWSPIKVRGTAAAPLVDGILDVDPGGLITAYGQTVRLDAATVTLRGQPGVEPELELVTTSSLEDPSVGQRDRRSLDPFERPPEQANASAGEAVTSGLSGYFAERVMGGVGNAVSGPWLGGFTIRPILILTESDPHARVLVTRDLTRHVGLGASINMRTAQDRTYLLDFHEFRGLPSLSGTIFTNESENQGLTLQQVLELGPGYRSRGPQIGKIAVDIADSENPAAPAPRRLVRAVSFERGDQYPPEGIAFDVEIEVEEALRRRGFSDPRVRARETARKNRVDLSIDVLAGERAAVTFVGIEPPRRLRRAIALTYRSDYGEVAALSEMRNQTVAALESIGWLTPTVEVERRMAPPNKERADDAPQRLVTVRSAAEQRVKLGNLRLDGLPEQETVLLSERYASLRSRVALAREDDHTARDGLLELLADLGWPAARITSFAIEDDGDTLRLDLDPGRRATWERVVLAGEETLAGEGTPSEEERQKLLEEIRSENAGIEVGEPASTLAAARAAAAIESLLRKEGYADARVLARRSAVLANDQVTDPTLDITIDSGPRYRIDSVRVEGLEATHEPWAASVTDAGDGETLDARTLAHARRRLLGTGLFRTVYLEPQKQPDGSVTLVVGAEEHPRYSFGYGLRWETEEGGGVVADLVDRNFLGRGIQVGLRGLYTEHRESGRLYTTLPRVFGSRYSIESFAELRSEDDDGLLSDTFEASLQLSRPVSELGTARVYARYLRERLRETAGGPLQDVEQVVRSPFVGVQYLWDNRADPFSGTGGLFASVDLSGSGDFLGSDFGYVRLFGQLQWTRPAFRALGRDFVWAQSLRMGLTEETENHILRDLRFFAGGEYSLRGYPTESLGPFETFGMVERPQGGLSLLVLNQELRFPIAGRFGGVLFYDLGNVWPERSDFGQDFVDSLGLGLRMHSPIGLIRLDAGFPLDRRPEERSVRFYLGLGQVF